jgi:uncharacterized damage-inducible protein DinB
MLIERFRTWYDHERDCNVKILQMLDSVPIDRRDDPAWQRALELMSHLLSARRNWLDRVRSGRNQGDWVIKGVTLTDLHALRSAVESEWTAFLDDLDDEELTRDFTWKWQDGNAYGWPLEEMLAQVHGHAWYHRGQIVLLVDSLGGETVDTDFIFWTPNVRRVE